MFGNYGVWSGFWVVGVLDLQRICWRLGARTVRFELSSPLSFSCFRLGITLAFDSLLALAFLMGLRNIAFPCLSPASTYLYHTFLHLLLTSPRIPTNKDRQLHPQTPHPLRLPSSRWHRLPRLRVRATYSRRHWIRSRRTSRWVCGRCIAI